MRVHPRVCAARNSILVGRGEKGTPQARQFGGALTANSGGALSTVPTDVKPAQSASAGNGTPPGRRTAVSSCPIAGELLSQRQRRSIL